MPSLKAIRRRIASVASTQKTTRAMKLVSSAKLHRAQEAMGRAAPYITAMDELARTLPKALLESFEIGAGSQPRALIVVVASDRGLCGAYNSNLMNTVDQLRTELRAKGLEAVFYAIGRRAVDHLNRTRATIVQQRVNLRPRLATIELARDVASYVFAAYRRGEISEGGIAYSVFRSVFIQRPTYRRLLPVERPPSDTAKSAVSETKDERSVPDRYFLMEPGLALLAPLVVKSYLEAEIFDALLNAETGEHAARMTAMDSATNNAGEMIERLTLLMNRVRQDSITRELMDIVGGAEALRESRS